MRCSWWCVPSVGREGPSAASIQRPRDCVRVAAWWRAAPRTLRAPAQTPCSAPWHFSRRLSLPAPSPDPPFPLCWRRSWDVTVPCLPGQVTSEPPGAKAASRRASPSVPTYVRPVTRLETCSSWALRSRGGSRRRRLRPASPSAVAPAFPSLSLPHHSDDGVRTRDPRLGKLMLYQLSHVRAVNGD